MVGAPVGLELPLKVAVVDVWRVTPPVLAVGTPPGVVNDSTAPNVVPYALSATAQ